MVSKIVAANIVIFSYGCYALYGFLLTLQQN